jgi:PKD repeat protein
VPDIDFGIQKNTAYADKNEDLILEQLRRQYGGAPEIDFIYENVSETALRFTPIIMPDIPVDEYDWDFGVGSAHSNEETPIHDYAS